MSSAVDFSALLHRRRGAGRRPARVARIVPREALRPASSASSGSGPSPSAAAAAAAAGAGGAGADAAAMAAAIPPAGAAASGIAAAGGGRSAAAGPSSKAETGTGTRTAKVAYALDPATGEPRLLGAFEENDEDSASVRRWDRILDGDEEVYVVDVEVPPGFDGDVRELLGGTYDADEDAVVGEVEGEKAAPEAAPATEGTEVAGAAAGDGEKAAGGAADKPVVSSESSSAAAAVTSSSSADEEEEEDEEAEDDASDDDSSLDPDPASDRWLSLTRRRSVARSRRALASALGSRLASSVASELASRTREYDAVLRAVHAEEEEEREARRRAARKGRGMLLTLGGEDERAELRRRIALERRRVRLERTIRPELHEVNMGDWEAEIDWEGAPDPDGKADEGGGGGGGGSKDGKDPEAAKKPADDGGDALSLLLAPRNPSLDAVDLLSPSWGVSWDGADAPPGYNRSLSRSVPLLLQSGVAGRSVALRSAPSRRPARFGDTDAYESRIEREVANAATSTAMSLGNTLNRDNEKLEKIIAARQERRANMAKEKSSRVMEAMGTLALGGGKGRTITSSLMGPGGTERTGRPSRHVGGISTHDSEYVVQLDMVYGHVMVKPDLTKSELGQFHRPRLPRTAVRGGRPWQFQVRIGPAKLAELVKAMLRKGARQGGGHRGMMPGAMGGGGDGSTLVGSYHAGSAVGGASAGGQAKTVRNEADLSPAEGDLILLEYCEERPPLQLSKAMASRIVNYYRGDKARCPISAGGGDRPTRKRQHGDKAGTSTDGTGGPGVGPGAKGGTGKAEKPPRLRGPDGKVEAKDLIGDFGGKKDPAAAAAEKEKEKEKKPKVKVLPEGVTEILHPKVHGPFIGEVEEGTTQTGLIANLFAAPMFRHDPEPTDFLMILGRRGGERAKHHLDRSGGGGLGVTLRPLPSNVYTVGQTEPRVKVFAPNTTGEKNFMTPFVTFHIAKALARREEKEGEGLRFDEISEQLFANTAILPNALRQRIKQVASYDKNTQIWTLKPAGFEDFPGVEGLARRFSPEGVAAYESESAAVRRLRDLGLHDLYAGTNSVAAAGAAMVYITGAMNAARVRKSTMSKMVEFAKSSRSRTKPKQVVHYERAAAKLEAEWKDLRRKHEVAKFIYEELQLAPWHLTSEFIDVHKQAQGTGMMKLTGLGDPSGQGEAFNFLREQDAKPNKGTGNSDGALNAQIKKITGTENDLRKLTMKQMASLLRSYGMGQKEIDTLKRWDRVHVIRDLSTKAASDGMGDGLERYARGEKMKLRDQKQMYRDRIQEIWRRQRAALSADAGALEVARAAPERGGVEGAAVAAAAAAGGTGGGGAEEDAEKNAALDRQLERDMGITGDSSDDSDDDDDLAAAFEEDLMDVKQTNMLVAAQMRGSDDVGGQTRGLKERDEAGEMSRDARELAALQRQREEEKAAQEGILGGGGSKAPEGDAAAAAKAKSNKGRKVIRRKLTKTHPDGTQTTTFKFIVQPMEVEKVLAAKKAKEREALHGPGGKKKKGQRGGKGGGRKGKDRDHHPRHDRAQHHHHHHAADDRRAVGHSMFEDDDDCDHRAGTKIKLQVSRKTRVVKTQSKRGGGGGGGGGVGGPSPRSPPGFGGKKAGGGGGGGPGRLGGGGGGGGGGSKGGKDKSAERRMKKRRREMEEADLYSTASKRMGTSNRRERGAARERMPHVIMSDRLESIRSECEKRPGSAPFHRPVNRRLIPRYYEVISEPIDLQTIRDRNQRYEYRLADSFVRDFDLMKANAIKFNGMGSILGNEATAMYEHVRDTIEANRADFDRMEDAVREQLSTGRKKAKKSGKGTKKSKQAKEEAKKAAASASSASAASANTANVVLDGIETTVNIGDISTGDFNFDGVGDSDSDDSVLGNLAL